MGWIGRLFGKTKNKKLIEEKQQQKTSGANISHHEGLMEEYLDDHKELVALITSVGKAAKSGHFTEVQNKLAEFKTVLEGHLLNENVRLYAYLEQQFRNQPENLQLVKDFRKEMRGIASAVTKFIKYWREAGVTAATSDAFMQEYQTIVNVLGKRINAEEKHLYPLYNSA